MPRNKEGGNAPEGGKGRERLRRPSYLDSRRYPSPEEAGRAYFETQEAVRRDSGRADLSVYRLMIGPLFESHVVVLGDTPNKKLLEELQTTLGTGNHVELDEETLAHLMERRVQAEKIGPWVEGHYRPGSPVRFPRRRR
jgi:hypothetical protein